MYILLATNHSLGSCDFMQWLWQICPFSRQLCHCNSFVAYLNKTYNKFNTQHEYTKTPLLIHFHYHEISFYFSNQPNHFFLGSWSIYSSKYLNLLVSTTLPLSRNSLQTLSWFAQVLWWSPYLHSFYLICVMLFVLIGTGKAENAVQVTKTLQDVKNHAISPQTVCRHLKKAGMKAVVKKKCSCLTS